MNIHQLAQFAALVSAELGCEKVCIAKDVRLPLLTLTKLDRHFGGEERQSTDGNGQRCRHSTGPEEVHSLYESCFKTLRIELLSRLNYGTYAFFIMLNMFLQWQWCVQ